VIAVTGRKLNTIRGAMLRITRSETENKKVTFRLSGGLGSENVAEVERLFESEVGSRPIVLDLEDLLLVDECAVSFLERCEADHIKLENCPAYIRQWIDTESVCSTVSRS
jgi:hypothetical protein